MEKSGQLFFRDDLNQQSGRLTDHLGLTLPKGWAGLSVEELTGRQSAAEKLLFQRGTTFAVYGGEAGIEKVWPIDILPRVISYENWKGIEKGLRQRVLALNLFIDDIYNKGLILRDGIVPEELILTSKGYLPQCRGLQPPHGIWVHIAGIDLVCHSDGRFYVLEDNLRCPSGVSYVLENREIMKRVLPEAFSELSLLPVEDYPEQLLHMLLAMAPVDEPKAVLLTPGIYNSAYFEHVTLAQLMGIELVQSCDLVVEEGSVMMCTTCGLKKVDVIYRRINDDYLDPNCFRKDSLLGVKGLMDAYRKGKVALVNAPGCGVVDDKAVYSYIPQVIRYYLGEEPILPNVPTLLCHDPKERDYVLKNLEKLVLKPVGESGGKGLLLGPKAAKKELEAYGKMISEQPREYIAQPMMSLSAVPTMVEDHLELRHVDLRPFIIQGHEQYILPGGLTRVALQRGSLIVNSSQGGGSKDTWVIPFEGESLQQRIESFKWLEG